MGRIADYDSRVVDRQRSFLDYVAVATVVALVGIYTLVYDVPREISLAWRRRRSSLEKEVSR